MTTEKEHDDGLTEEERAALQEDDGANNTDSQGDEGNDPDDQDSKDGDGDGDNSNAADAGGDDGADAKASADTPSRDDGEGNKEQEMAAQQGAPILVVEPPADADDKLKEISTKKEELITQFDDGDITAKEYQQQLDALSKQEREIERALERATLAAEMEQQRLKNEWLTTVNAFIDANPVYKDNQRLYRALDQEVRDVANSEEGKTLTGAKILAKAHENLAAAFNLAKPEPQKDVKPDAKPPKADLPPSIHNVPAADANDVTGGKYAALDRLAQTNPLAYEEALMKLPEEERNSYLASA
jgi:hypothetical protein